MQYKQYDLAWFMSISQNTRRDITLALISHLKQIFLDDLQKQVLRVVGALLGYYQESCFVDLNEYKKSPLHILIEFT